MRRGRKPTTTPERHEQPDRLTGWLAMGLVVLAAVLVYANTLGNGFVIDDGELIRRNPQIRDLGNIPRFFVPPVRTPGVSVDSQGYRPLRTVVNAIDYQLFGLEPWGYHATNLLLHAIASFLAYLVAMRLLGGTAAALLTGLLFAVHPVQTEAVAYVTGRKDTLVTIFYLLGVFCAIQDRASGRRRWLIGAGIAFAFALFSKESGITMPLILLLLGAVMGMESEPRRSNQVFRQWRQGLTAEWRRARIWYIGIALIAVVFGWYVAVYSGASAKEGPWGGGVGPMWLTVGRIYLHYLTLWLFPLALSASYGSNPFPVPDSIVDPVGLLAVAATAALLYGTIRLTATSRIAAFGGLWFFITLLPVVQIVPHHILIADRHLVLPSFGLALMAGALFERLEGNALVRRALWPSAVVLLLLLSARTVVRNRDWRDEFTIWSEAARTTPRSARAHSAVGNILRRRNRQDEAERAFRTALDLDPNEASAHVGLGALLAARGQSAVAEQELLTAVRLDSNSFGYNELGRLYQRQGRSLEAEAAFNKAIRLNPTFDEARLNLGLVYLNQGRVADAERQIRIAMEINPDSGDAHLALGRIAAQAGRQTEAVDHFQAAANAGDNAFAHNNLGVLYAQMGRLEQARGEFEVALRISPDFAEARANLARLNR